MTITFCGAAQTVTGSCHLITLDDGFKILLDCGLYQGRDRDIHALNESWIFHPSEIDVVILSHAHIDHCGRIPKLVKDGFQGKIYATPATQDLVEVLLLDSAKIQVSDAAFGNKQHRKRGEPETERPLYTVEDAQKSLQHFEPVNYNQEQSIRPDVSFEFRDSGHIFGSASITLRIRQDDGTESLIGFSGDIGRWDRLILRDPEPQPPVDYMICESTYGGKTHDGPPQDQNELLEIVKRTCVDRKGKLIIPAFSVGRTQELVHAFDRLETEGKLPPIPVYVDSPMAVNATQVFKKHPECFDQDVIDYLETDPDPFGFNRLYYIREAADSKKLNSMKGPAIIISSSGMMNAGRIRHHLLNHIEDPRNTLLIVGFCAPGTTGAHILSGAETVRLFGLTREIRAEVISIDGYSGHADEPEMLRYLSSQDKKKLKGLFLVHGNRKRQEAFASTLQEEGYRNVFIPELGEERPL